VSKKKGSEHPIRLTTSLLSQANEAERAGNLSLALFLYQKIETEAEGFLANQINSNIIRVRKKIGELTDAPRKVECPTKKEKNAIDEKKTEVNGNVANEIEDISPYFKSNYYLNRYEDIKRSGVDPILHYCTQGWKELRNPHPDFSTKAYLELNEDVAKAGINPFWHYVVAGKAEGRALKHPGGVPVEIIKRLPKLEQIVKAWKKTDKPSNVLGFSDFLEVLEAALVKDSRASKLMISISHDNYRVVPGGLQLCVQREEQLAIQAGYVYVNFHPWQPLPILTKSSDPLMELVVNGDSVGQCRASDITKVIGELKAKRNIEHVLIVHSLLGHSISRLKELAQITKKTMTFFWLHDFFTLCPSYALQRNNVVYCESPPPDSNACSICIYGKERLSHLQNIKELFSDIKINIISPSDVALSLWKLKGGYTSASEHVVPHREIVWQQVKNTQNEALEVKKIKLAYVGGPVFHKGWFVFKELVRAFENSSHFSFYHFGTNSESIERLQIVNAHVTAKNYDAMVESIAREQIDFVVNWANWPETFSFTAFEAIAAGADVLTNSISGNVAYLVRKTGRGRVFHAESDLHNYLRSPEILDVVREIRVRRNSSRAVLTMSEMSLSILAKGANRR
jgi:hypothetical protein